MLECVHRSIVLPETNRKPLREHYPPAVSTKRADRQPRHRTQRVILAGVHYPAIDFAMFFTNPIRGIIEPAVRILAMKTPPGTPALHIRAGSDP